MDGAQEAGPQAATWFVEPDRTTARPPPRKVFRMRWDDGGETSMRAVIASSFFIMLLGGALLIGGHAAIDPLLRLAISARDGRAIGDVVLTMPDGKFCRHMSFDNNTAEMMEGDVERCPDSIAGEQFRTVQGFSWGGR